MIADYMGIPFRRGGRDFSGCDCWGFVRLVLMGERNIEIPSCPGACSDDAPGIEHGFEAIDSPEDWCIVMMSQEHGRAHVGIWLEGWIMHMCHEGVVNQPASRVRMKIMGYYRCRE